MMNDETTSPDLGLLVEWTRNGSSQTGALTIRAAGEVLLADDGKITRQDFRDRATKTMFDVAGPI